MASAQDKAWKTSVIVILSVVFGIFVIQVCFALRRDWIRRTERSSANEEAARHRLGRGGAGGNGSAFVEHIDLENATGRFCMRNHLLGPVLRNCALAADQLFRGKIGRQRRVQHDGQRGLPTDDSTSVQDGESGIDVGVLPPGVYARDSLIPAANEANPQDTIRSDQAVHNLNISTGNLVIDQAQTNAQALDPTKSAQKEADIAYHQAINDIRRVPRQPENPPATDAEGPNSGTMLGRLSVGSIRRLFTKKEQGLPVREAPRVQWPPRPRPAGDDGYNARTNGEYRNVQYSASPTSVTPLNRGPRRPPGDQASFWPQHNNRVSSQAGPQAGSQAGPQAGPQRNPQRSPQRKPAPGPGLAQGMKQGPIAMPHQIYRQPDGQDQGRVQMRPPVPRQPLSKAQDKYRNVSQSPIRMCRLDSQEEVTVRRTVLN